MKLRISLFVESKGAGGEGGDHFLVAITFAFFVSFESEISTRREKDWKLARIRERSSRESTSLVYLTNKVVAVLWLPAEQPDTYRERDLFLVFRIAKAFAEDTLSRSPSRRWINLLWHSFSRIVLMTEVTEREGEKARYVLWRFRILFMITPLSCRHARCRYLTI